MSGGAVAKEIREGARDSRDYTITAEIYDRFVAAFGDVNPIHSDDEYARKLGYPGKIAHGVILNGFISHFLGMHYPGGGVLLHSLQTTFRNPCHVSDCIRIEAVVGQVSRAVGVAVVELTLTNITRATLAAKAKAQLGLLE
jgi:acyl dehydratase